MRIIDFSAENYRNLKNVELHACEGINVIYGDNAQGKTNLIEGIWLFSGNKSFRGAKDNELINKESNFSRLHINFFAENRDQQAKINISPKRQALLNNIELKSPSELSGKLRMIVFSPAHLTLIKGGPAERRKFIDSAISQIRPQYIKLMREYVRAVTQRNSVLKDVRFSSQLIDMLEVFEGEIARTGAKIIMYRKKYIEELIKYAPDIYGGLSGGKEMMSADYICECYGDTVQGLTDELADLLFQRRKDDINFGFTSIGPHRDDIDIKINGLSARSYGSQGQQRSAVLTLKMAEAAVLKTFSNEQPVALLDDVMSELDEFRQNYILNHINEWQVFLTCCDKNSVGMLKCGKAFRMENGLLFTE